MSDLDSALVGWTRNIDPQGPHQWAEKYRPTIFPTSSATGTYWKNTNWEWDHHRIKFMHLLLLNPYKIQSLQETKSPNSIHAFFLTFSYKETISRFQGRVKHKHKWQELTFLPPLTRTKSRSLDSRRDSTVCAVNGYPSAPYSSMISQLHKPSWLE